MSFNPADAGELAAHRWYALHVRSRHERVVEKSLEEKGYTVLYPFYRTKRKRVQRVVKVDVPLFPGYIFCHFDATKRLPVLKTPGVVTVVGCGRPEPVDDREMASLQTVIGSGLPVGPWPFLRTGQKIRMQGGPLAGAEGTLLRIKNQTRLVVSITLLQRSVVTEVDQEFVEPLF